MDVHAFVYCRIYHRHTYYNIYNYIILINTHTNITYHLINTHCTHFFFCKFSLVIGASSIKYAEIYIIFENKFQMCTMLWNGVWVIRQTDLSWTYTAQHILTYLKMHCTINYGDV